MKKIVQGKVIVTAIDSTNGLFVRSYASPKEELKDTMFQFGATTKEEFEEQVELMTVGEHAISNHVSDSFIIPNILDVVIPTKVIPDGQEHYLFDCEIESSPGVSTVSTVSTMTKGFSFIDEAIKCSSEFDINNPSDISSIMVDKLWNTQTNTLKCSLSLITISNPRVITPEQAEIFDLANTF